MIHLTKNNKDISKIPEGTKVLVINKICTVEVCKNCKKKYLRKLKGKNRAKNIPNFNLRPSNTYNCSKKCAFEYIGNIYKGNKK